VRIEDEDEIAYGKTLSSTMDFESPTNDIPQKPEISVLKDKS
jgi:hypothetical protein